MADLVILVPVLGRPHRVRPFLESLAANTPIPYRVLFLCTEGDSPQIRAVIRSGQERIMCGPRKPGDYARKMNIGFDATTEPLIFLGADDLLFHPNWFENARALMKGRVGVVGTNDLGNPRVIRGIHSTHSLISRDYVNRYGTIDEPGKILHEGYDHAFCDDELIATARHRHAYAWAHNSLVEHLHPHWRKGSWDSTYQLADRSLHTGRVLFNERRRLWKGQSR